MRIRVTFTVEVSDVERELIAAYYGLPEPATWDEVRAFYAAYGQDGDVVLGDVAASRDERERYESMRDDD